MAGGQGDLSWQLSRFSVNMWANTRAKQDFAQGGERQEDLGRDGRELGWGAVLALKGNEGSSPVCCLSF